jgi:hypothetical protein
MAEYARILGTGVDDDWVVKRKKAAARVVEWYRGLSTLDALGAASALSSAIVGTFLLPSQLASKGEATIQEYAPSFLRDSENGDLEILVVMLAAAAEFIAEVSHASGWNAQDALAAGLWSALWFQVPLSEAKLEKLRTDLLKASRDHVLAVANSSRTRRVIPQVGPVNIGQDSPAGQKVNTAFAKAVQPLLEALVENAALDREELDFAWWLLSDRSDTLDKPFGQFENGPRAVVTGFEAALRLRKLPADAHRHMVQRNIINGGEMSLSELLSALGDDRGKIAAAVQSPLQDLVSVFPLLVAIQTGSGPANVGDQKFGAREWAAKSLLESAIYHLQFSSKKMQ